MCIVIVNTSTKRLNLRIKLKLIHCEWRYPNLGHNGRPSAKLPRPKTLLPIIIESERISKGKTNAVYRTESRTTQFCIRFSMIQRDAQ